jgi:hypothetical protein
MSGPTFASPSFEELRGRLEIATPASTLRSGGGERRDGLAAILHLGCIAMVCGLTICVFFGLAFYFLAHPADEIVAASGAGDRGGDTLTRWVLTGSVPAGSEPAFQATQPSTTGQPVQLAATALAGPAEPRPVQVHQKLGLKRIENASADIVSGPVTGARDAMTWVVAGQILHLWGIRPDLRPQPASLARFVAQVGAAGSINCRRQAHSTRYLCAAATHEDIAETELLSGLGRAADGATLAYRNAESQARDKGTRR